MTIFQNKKKFAAATIQINKQLWSISVDSEIMQSMNSAL